MGMANGPAADQPSGSTRLKRPSALTYLLSAGVGGGAAVADAGGVAPAEQAPMRAARAQSMATRERRIIMDLEIGVSRLYLTPTGQDEPRAIPVEPRRQRESGRAQGSRTRLRVHRALRGE